MKTMLLSFNCHCGLSSFIRILAALILVQKITISNYIQFDGKRG